MNRWNEGPSGLLFREDEFSWQGASAIDKFVFFRRLKGRPSELTDFNLGNLDEPVASALLEAFFQFSGGIVSGRCILTRIGNMDDPHDGTVALFDRIVAVFRRALLQVNCKMTNAFLDPDGNGWNIVIDVECL